MKLGISLVVVCLVFCNLAAEGAMVNLVQNHSFERGSDLIADNWSKAWGGYSRVVDCDSWNGSFVIKLQNPPGTTTYAGASQRIDFNQTCLTPIRFSVRVKGFDIANLPADNFGACLYAQIHMVDGSVAYTKNTLRTKNVGTFPWRWIGFNSGNIPEVKGPIAYVVVTLMLGKVPGVAIFDSVVVEVYPRPNRGRVTFMADDGWESTYNTMYPILRAKGMVGVSAVITNYVGRTNYMNLSQIHELESFGRWEIMSHSQDHVDLTTLSPDDMESQYWESRKYFRDNGFRVESIALPFGAYNGEVMGRAEWYWRSARGVERGDNPPGMLPNDVRIQEINGDTDPSLWMSWIEQAQTDHHWLILLFHRVTDAPGEVKPETFCRVVETVCKSGMEVVTYKKGLDLYSLPPPQNAVKGWSLYY